MICDLCSAEFIAPSRAWRRCEICTFNPPRRGRAPLAAGPGWAVPRATSDRVTFIVPGRPFSTNRALHTAAGHWYYSPEGKRYKTSVAAHALAALGRTAWDRTRSYTLSIDCYFQTNRSDSDNVIKPVRDALQGILYDNDRQIVSDHTEKFVDAASPRLVITVQAA